MAITHIDTHINYSNTPVTVTAPNGIENGDILVACAFAYKSGVSAITLPSGFTEWINHTSLADRYICIGWKRASGESGDYAFGSTASNDIGASVSCFRGALASGDPLDVYSNTGYTITNTECRAAAMTTTVGGARVWWGYSYYAPGHTLDRPSGWSEGATIITPSGNHRMTVAYICDAAEYTPGDTGVQTGTISGSCSTKHAMMVQFEAAAASGASIPVIQAAQQGSNINITWL